MFDWFRRLTQRGHRHEYDDSRAWIIGQNGDLLCWRQTCCKTCGYVRNADCLLIATADELREANWNRLAPQAEQAQNGAVSVTVSS